MMKMHILLPVLLFLGLLAQAENLTNNGKVYVDFALATNRCTAGAITFTHKSGASKIDFSDMSDENKARFGYDSAAYTAFKEEEARIKRETPPPPPPSTTPPAEPQVTQPRIVRKTVVYTNSAPHTPTFGTSPVTDIRPDQKKMNDARLKAYQKAMELNGKANRNE